MQHCSSNDGLLEGKESSPCTNVPLNCLICPVRLNKQCRTFWKYNFIQHMTQEHLMEEGRLSSCFPELIEPKRTTTFRITNKHFGVRNNDESVLNSEEVFEQRKKVGVESFSSFKFISVAIYETRKNIWYWCRLITIQYDDFAIYLPDLSIYPRTLDV